MSKLLTLSKNIIKNKAAQNFIIIGIIAVFQLINNVILGRYLAKGDFGIYSFVFNNIVGLFSIILLFGRNSSILRYFSSKNFLDYSWKKYIVKFNFFLIFPIFVAIFSVKIFYHLDWFWFWMGLLSTYLMSTTQLISSFLRSKKFFITTMLLERAHPIILTLILLILNFSYNSININTSSFAKIFSYSIQIPVLIYIMIKWKEGSIPIEKSIFKDSFAFWELNISVVVLSSIDSFFIVKILSYEELALFSIIGSLLVIYEFARISIFHVYSQKFSQNNKIDIISFHRILIMLIFIVSIFYLISANFILKILFAGKYIISFKLLILFCIYHSISLLYVIPSCYIMGKSSSKDLKFMLGVNLASIAIKICLIVLMSKLGLGLSGFLIAGIISYLLRTALAYYMVIKNTNLNWKSFLVLNK